MRPDALLQWMKRHEAAPAARGPLCELCAGTSGHVAITDGPDAPAICYPCLLKRGRWAGSPASLDTERLTALWSAHEDVLELVRCPAHGEVEWRWIAWSSDRDTLADPDGALLAYAAAMVVAHRAEAAGGRL